MSATAAAPPAAIGPRQRLNATAALSLLVHAVLILGLGFALKGEAPLVPTLDVIFSQTQTPLSPEQADFLAQANNRGGGEHEQDEGEAAFAGRIHRASDRVSGGRARRACRARRARSSRSRRRRRSTGARKSAASTSTNTA